MKKLLLIILCFLSIKTQAADTTLVIKRLSPVPKLVDKSGDVKLDLNGNWYFNPAPSTGFENSTVLNTNWSKIAVPGEWVMQGFNVEKNAWAGYARSFTVPASWKDKRIKLRCDAVYSESQIFIDGKKVGNHLGGFTPFEFDVTDFVAAGTSSNIVIKVKNESIADKLASGTQYAVHPLGGISRKIYLMALPVVNVSMFHIATSFDNNYQNAILKTELQLANETNAVVKNTSLNFELFAPSTHQLVFSKKIALDEKINSNSNLDKIFEFAIQQPVKWDPEHPNLYSYRLTIETNGTSEIVERKIGFRQIDVRGKRVFVNNLPIKLRGVCRHEVDPLRGRSLIGDEWMKDVLLFREANVNYIRTSHYPPAEEFIDACDSLGMFVEVEAPFCWAHVTNVPDSLFQAAIIDQTLDMVNFFRSAPSVLDWSLANESEKAYEKYFRKTGELVKKLDPTRPRIYNQSNDPVDNGELELENYHYPGPDGPAKYANSKRPVMFGEFTHLNAYNRTELVTDPGLRDAWGIGFKNMWEKMYATPAILGGCIWAGIDDTFILPDGQVVGYGTWGPLDGWRRKKPEFWHVKKSYSPVKIQLTGNIENDQIQLIITNRFLFSNVNECKIKWHSKKYSGEINTSIALGEKQMVAIKFVGKLMPEDSLYLDIYDPRNVLIDQYAFAAVPQEKELLQKAPASLTNIKYTQTGDAIIAQTAAGQIKLNKANGMITISKSASQKPMLQLGELMLLPLKPGGGGTQMTGNNQTFDPLTNTCANRVVKKIEYSCQPDKFIVTVYDDYVEATGYMVYEFSNDKNIAIKYHYILNADINPRQWGLVVSLANDFNTLFWQRNGLWDFYPGDHIGRLSGTANAFSLAPVSGAAGSVQKPNWSWALDRNDLGSNDFRSTKMYINEAGLRNDNATLKIIGDGSQHVRAWKDYQSTKLLIAAYSNLGSEHFFRTHAVLFNRPLKQGDIIEDMVHLQMQ